VLALARRLLMTMWSMVHVCRVHPANQSKSKAVQVINQCLL
jgi:uncharacterized protein YhhL (DUF1145 family)